MVPFTRHRSPRSWFVPVRSRPTLEERDTPRRRRRWAVVALLAGYLLFCHGCHGDEDNELFTGRRHAAALIDTVSLPR